MMPMEVNTAGEVSDLDNVSPTNVDTTVSRASKTDEPARKTCVHLLV